VLTTADGQSKSLVISMTGQITNRFKYEGEFYELVAYHGESLYTAEDFGIIPQMASTACWRGYQTFYDCVGELVIENKIHWEYITWKGFHQRNVCSHGFPESRVFQDSD